MLRSYDLREGTVFDVLSIIINLLSSCYHLEVMRLLDDESYYELMLVRVFIKLASFRQRHAFTI